jgi:MYXO-CTERM domain-containing protein
VCTAVAILTIASGGRAALIVADEVGDARASATNVDAFFDLEPNADIFDSTTVAHASVFSTNDAVTDVDWYSFTGVEGASVFLDIDCGAGCGDSVDTTVALFDGAGTLLAFGDDSSPLDPGTADDRDSFVGVYGLPGSGTYFIAVSNYDRFPAAIASCEFKTQMTRPDDALAGGSAVFGCTPGDDSFTGGSSSTGEYTLHISNTQPVPEPSPSELRGAGLAALAALGLRRRYCARSVEVEPRAAALTGSRSPTSRGRTGPGSP